MFKFQQIDLLLQILSIALVSSIVRLIYFRTDSFVDNLLTFIGGTLVGTLVGCLIIGTDYESYSPALTSCAALTGKEVTNLVVKTFPQFLRNFVKKNLPNDNDTKL